MAWWDELKYDDKGLLTAVVQDYATGDVLMVAFMNREAVERTATSGFTCFWSRSRQELWEKGATSGNRQVVREICVDCDADALVVKVDQTGGACHTGHRSCFYRKLDDGGWQMIGEQVFDPEKAYGKRAE
jgi:phosphoribosyl-AMP cyclohydrolase